MSRGEPTAAGARGRLAARLEHAVFVALVLAAVGLLGWLSTRYTVHTDWTAAKRNTLSDASARLLERMEGPIAITAYARDKRVLRESVAQLVGRYRRAKPDLTLELVDPDREPEAVRRLGITVDGELVVRYRDRTEHVERLNESALTNALQRLARDGERWIGYITGHGERDLTGRANHDLGRFGAELSSRGFTVGSVVLGEAGAVPDNTSVLVVSEPEVALLPGETEALGRWIEAGGNLLWLSDPRETRHLAPLAEALGVAFRPGVVVDPGARLLGIDHPANVIVSSYAERGATRGFELVTVLPHAAAIAAAPPPPWSASAIMRTGLRTWAETADPPASPTFHRGTDVQGPLDVAVALERTVGGDGAPRRDQRVIVVGDGDFLSNAYLGNGGNLDLGMAMVNWLAADDALIDIPAKLAPDVHFDLARPAALFIALAALVALPLGFLATGASIWYTRRRR